MSDVLFLTIVFVIGLFFGLNFYRKISLQFILYSSFLWGAVILSLSTMTLRIFNIGLIGNQNLLFIGVLCTVLIIPIVFFSKPKFAKNDLLIIFLSTSVFFLINFFFHTFNFSLATIDSFALILLGRTNVFDGMSPYVLNSFTSWGLLIPTLQSFSVFLGIDYFVSLAANFALSIIFVFGYFCFTFCKQILQNDRQSKWITWFMLTVLITTPMFIIQTFFIHTNLPAASYMLLLVCIAWMYIKNPDDALLILLFVSMVGLSMCRSETFIYTIPVLVLLLVSTRKINKALFLSSSIFLVLVSSWLVYLYFNIPTGTVILDKARIFALVCALIIFFLFITGLRNPLVSEKGRPLISRLFLVPFFAMELLMIILKPAHMLASNSSIINNLFFWGDWGMAFWLWLIVLIMYLVFPQKEICFFLNKIVVSTMLMISCLSFFRNPYRLSWNDSANRLLTLVFPLILIMLAINIANFVKRKNTYDEPESV
jgi:hypothetical protein